MKLNRRAILWAGLACMSFRPAVAQGEVAFPLGVTWLAESLGDVPFAQVSRPSLRITPEGQVQGSSGCNRYSGAALIKGSQLLLGPLAMTRMACFGAGGQNERLFAPAIAAAASWRMDQRMLVIETARGPLRFRRR